jgi:competence protein ComFC
MISPMTFKAIAKNFINLLYPRHCEYCKKAMPAEAKAPLCHSCMGQIKRSPDIRTGSRNSRHYFTNARSACIYEGVLAELIHSFKYKGKITLAAPLASFMIELAASDRELMDGIKAVTYVPVQDSFMMKRDYNHSGVLAGRLGKEFGLPVLDNLKKIRRTRPQNELSRDERLVNLKGAFAVKDGQKIAGLKILLIDDVMTTGATLDECSKVLLENGADEVRCLTLSRGV